jgi:hypothetical protein
MPEKIDLNNLFSGLEKQLIATLTTNRENILHPGEKGDATELCWVQMLNDYLPRRYQSAKAFVVDADGIISDQIDVVIFDRQYSPFLFNQGGACYVPAESVYAILEVKQDLDKGHIEYAGDKASTVRSLRRTSAKIQHAGGTYEPRPLFPIMAGILTLGNTWTPPFGDCFKSAISSLPAFKRVDLGCSLQFGSFSIRYFDDRSPEAVINCKSPLMFFFLTLLSRLQALGTVPAMQIDEYAKSLKE